MSANADEQADFEYRYGRLDLHDSVKLMARVAQEKETVEARVKELNKLYDWLRINRIPGQMDALETNTVTYEGIGRVSITADLHASIVSVKKEEAHLWLSDHGHGGLIVPQVNASSLKAFVKTLILSGNPPPAELFSYSPFSRASITKVQPKGIK